MQIDRRDRVAPLRSNYHSLLHEAGPKCLFAHWAGFWGFSSHLSLHGCKVPLEPYKGMPEECLPCPIEIQDRAAGAVIC